MNRRGLLAGLGVLPVAMIPNELGGLQTDVVPLKEDALLLIHMPEFMTVPQIDHLLSTFRKRLNRPDITVIGITGESRGEIRVEGYPATAAALVRRFRSPSLLLTLASQATQASQVPAA